MKLLVLINGWSGKIISGGDYHILRVMKEWNNSHHISLIIPLIGLLSCQPLLSDRYKIYLSSSGSGGIYSFTAIPAYLKRIIRAIFLRFKDKPDVIVCSSHFLYDTLPGFILQLRFRAKRVVYVHHIISEHADYRSSILSRVSILSERLSLPLIRSANIVIVVNEDVRGYLIKIGFDSSKILLSTNGVDYNAIESVRPIGNITYDGCFCGRLVKVKGVYDLIDIWKLVTKSYPDSKLVIVGDGPEYATLSNKIKEANLERNIQLMGFVSEREKFLTMQRSKIFIFPSYEEGWGIAVAEAIACGLDVVLYDIGAYKALEGHLVKVEKANTQKMAQAAVELIEKHMQKNSAIMKMSRIGSLPDWEDVANKELDMIKCLVDT
jgi:glycosyltransferase involved in cell wall biosynthesis